jgi:hypothetical protein
MTAVTALGDTLAWIRLLGIRGTIGVYLMGAVVLIVTLAIFAFETSPDLCADANSVANLDGLDILSHFHSATDYFVANSERSWVVAPSIELMYIRATDATGLDSDINVGGLEDFGGELA